MIREARLNAYYRLHAPLYDHTRWAFLFGRSDAVGAFARFGEARRILEVGCGTGRNLVELALRYPDAEIVGVDLSRAMLERAAVATQRFGARVRLEEGAYGEQVQLQGWPDAILFSYSLSMMGPAMEGVLQSATRDLGGAGLLVAVDFDDSPSGAFRAWMRRNHVDVDGRVHDALARHARTLESRSVPAFGGLWTWRLHVGQPHARDLRAR